jgi:hypothetical protein
MAASSGGREGSSGGGATEAGADPAPALAPALGSSVIEPLNDQNNRLQVQSVSALQVHATYEGSSATLGGAAGALCCKPERASERHEGMCEAIRTAHLSYSRLVSKHIRIVLSGRHPCQKGRVSDVFSTRIG